MESSLINGRYQIISTLRQGGFGETFLVKDLQLPSQRQCVLKSLKVNATSAQMIQEMQRRFQREAAILEGLGEKNDQIPKLFAYFEQQGRFYLVQEWIDGLTLQDIVQQQGCLSPSVVQKILLDLLPVLQTIHDQYIIHRDIKPENIMLRTSDRRPVLIDFGAVKEALSTAIYLDHQAPVSMAIGTPGYMAPEQGTGRPVYSSDLYGLGFTAIYLLTGNSPQNFPADPQTGELLWQTDFPYLDTPLGQVIQKAVKFHPRDRYPTAQKMLLALRGAASPQTPTATAMPSSSQATQTVATKVLATPQPTRTPTALASSASPPDTETEPGGCWRIVLMIFFFSIVGITAGIWVTLSMLGRSPQMQTFPKDPELEAPLPEAPAFEPIPMPESEPEETPIPEPEEIPLPDPEIEPTPEPETNPVEEPTPIPEPEPIPTPEPTPVPEPEQPPIPAPEPVITPEPTPPPVSEPTEIVPTEPSPTEQP